MKASQVSVFISNKPGELAKLASRLASFNINIKAVSVIEGMDYGVARMIVNEADRAGAALMDHGYSFVTTSVVMAEIPDHPGSLSALCQNLADNDINIRYIYATVTPGGGVAQAVISTEDDDRADELVG